MALGGLIYIKFHIGRFRCSKVSMGETHVDAQTAKSDLVSNYYCIVLQMGFYPVAVVLE
jgi:hypothetical protein